MVVVNMLFLVASAFNRVYYTYNAKISLIGGARLFAMRDTDVQFIFLDRVNCSNSLRRASNVFAKYPKYGDALDVIVIIVITECYCRRLPLSIGGLKMVDSAEANETKRCDGRNLLERLIKIIRRLYVQRHWSRYVCMREVSFSLPENGG